MIQSQTVSEKGRLIVDYNFKGISLKCDITLYLRNDPMVLLVIPAGKIICIDQTVAPQEVKGGTTDLLDMLPVEYRASGWPNRIRPIAAWVRKSLLDEAISYTKMVAPVL